ncbi:error-prone DNA polymerase [Sphingobium nicotianae]|uniref:Error-prone DNA polymerase n=1 Tax=Sphingobium nicotianae TaxID=2782607 RepID=A0A9X1DFR6_9SPHN|nr:error-prone DNA polymerase [Sphingobium nicotianae]MBT2188718.1 error-prone DNA polymerase [Sphingobium nicotianae]
MSGMPDPSAYIELACTTAYSFLHGASHPAQLVNAAIALGHTGIGIADRNTVSGVVRAKIEIDRRREEGEYVPDDFQLVTGARLVFADGTSDIIVYPETRHGWGRLTRLLTTGNRRAQKGECELHLRDLLEHIDDLLLIALPGATLDLLQTLRKAAKGRVWLGAVMNRAGRDMRQLVQAQSLADTARVPLIALNDALYAAPEDRPLQDVMTAIRLHTTVQKAGRALLAHAERHLKEPAEMLRLFAACPDAIVQTRRFLSRIGFRLEDLAYEYPHEPVPPGWEAQDWLEHLVMEAAHERYGPVLPKKVVDLIAKEFALVRQEKYAHYFLTVHDIVRYARTREPPILCQGRGSAANSIICFLLGVTSIDPMQHDLLFSRFLSAERKEPPDIDVDFEHERREEVIQYMYKRYGRERAGIAATVIHYRARSAVREVGKALGISEDVTARLGSTIWGSYASTYERKRVEESGFDPESPQIARLNDFVQRILNLPRHLSQHVGGFVLTQGRLDEMVPIHNAAMDDRTFIEWDKDDIDALRLMKVDVLALGMLTCISKAFDLMRRHDLGDHSLELDIDASDEAVYEMLQKGDSIGVFQVESRAQMNMLPRLKPKVFYDLVVQVAIVRPGPIEGDMVHPYLRRRCGEEAVDFPAPSPQYPQEELHGVLGKTFGVPLFQEQAMQLAITAAAFTDEEANGLRRAMATFRNLGTIDRFRDKMIGGMVGRGYRQDFAERCFKQIEGFGSYGFPESHAQSFARLVYVSAWIKCHQPAVFTCALLNSQPMGFYAPAQLVRDAIEHGVEVRPVDVNASDWDNGLESPISPSPSGEGEGVGTMRQHRSRSEETHCGSTTPTPPLKRRGLPSAPAVSLALRLGFRQISGFKEDWGHAIMAARARGGPFTSIEQLARRAGLPSRALNLLADADAMRSLGQDRREALWEVRRTPTDELPLFAAARARELGEEAAVALKPMTLGEHVAADYQTHRLSLKAHPMQILRHHFAAEGVLPCAALRDARAGAQVRVGGVVLVRQRPGKGNAIFVTLEDEDAICNIVLWARRFEAYRREVMAARLMIVDGELQRSREGVMHVMASRVLDRTELLGRLSETHEPNPVLSRADEFLHPQHPRHIARARSSGHPRNARLLPNSRDFH